jgi:histidinol-phosphate aminotransferase
LAACRNTTSARRELAAYFKVAEDEFALTNGTDEAIQILINTYVDDEDEVLILKAAYAMYRFYAEVAGAQVREIAYRAGTLSFPLQELLGAINPPRRPF